MITRAWSRGFAIVGEIVMTLILLLPIFVFDNSPGEKIGLFLLWLLFTLLIKDVISGKVWDSAHSEAGKGEEKISREGG